MSATTTAEARRGGRGEREAGEVRALMALGNGQEGGYRWETHAPSDVPREKMNMKGEVVNGMKGNVTLIYKESSTGW